MGIAYPYGGNRMPNPFNSTGLSEWASAALVVAVSLVVGYEASLGMSPSQWLGGAAAVLGSISVAVMVRVWPSPVRVAQTDKRRAD